MEPDTGTRAQPPLLAHFLGKITATASAAATAARTDTPTCTSAGDHSSSTAAQQLPPPEKPADPQTESPFFTRLPSEIRRMIYVEVWRTYGSDGYGAEEGGEAGEKDDTHARAHMTARGGLSPHITAVMAPSIAWLTSPLPGTESSSADASVGSSSRSDGGSDLQQRPSQQAASPPWTRQIRGFTSAPCFLAVDEDGDDDSDEYDAKGRRDSLRATARAQRRPPEAEDIRPRRLAAAHRADLDAVAITNSIYESSDTGTPSSTWRARWNSPWLGHWVCEEYYSGAGQSHTQASGSYASLGNTATTNSDSAPAYSHSHRRRRPPLRRPYLPVLLSCRRAYIEGIDLLYSALTFQFTEMATAEGFLARWPCVSSVRLVMHLSNSLLEFYLRPNDSDQAIITAAVAGAAHDHDRDPGPGAVTIGTFPRQDERDLAQPPGVGGGTVINARNNAWERLCAGLAPDRLPNLRRLHVWVEAHDLRGWPKTAAETRLFAQLLTAAAAQRRLTPERFVLYLPTLPPMGNKARELPGCYLGEEDEGEEVVVKDVGEEGEDVSKGKNVADVVDPRPPLPCTIVRTERPDYWDVHMHMRPVYVNRRMSVGSRVSALRRAGFL